MIGWHKAAREVRQKGYAHEDDLVLGSWIARVYSDQLRYIDFLRAHFRQETAAPAPCAHPHPARIRLIHCDAGHPAFQDAIPEDSVSVESAGNGKILVATPLLRTLALRTGRRQEITMFLLGDTADDSVLTMHFAVVFRRVLLEFGLFYLHAGAVAWNGRVSLFIGEKGAGKSTICLRLGQEGACLLSEDHVLVRRRRGRYLVSGSDRIARVTCETERFLFTAPLGTESRDFAGIAKKEFLTTDLFRCDHFRDYAMQNVFFPRIGREFSIRPMAEAAAALKLLTGNKHGLRFMGRTDYDHFLEFFTGMVAGKRIFDLELSPDPRDLNQLVEFLRHE